MGQEIEANSHSSSITVEVVAIEISMNSMIMDRLAIFGAAMDMNKNSLRKNTNISTERERREEDRKETKRKKEKSENMHTQKIVVSS